MPQREDGQVSGSGTGSFRNSNYQPSILRLDRMTPFSLRRFALLLLRVANLTFGGGDPTMAALHRELVVKRGWLPPDRYGLIYSLARATPGTNLLAFCAG